jgi:hypothetical protein
MLFIAEQWRGLALPTPAEARRRAQPVWARASGIGRGSAAGVEQGIIIGFEFWHDLFVV